VSGLISYNDVIFTGDTLFSSGCGRFFEGNAEEMLKNMDKIANLEDQVQIFCGHEYTL
jgi:hydroxyacylglutathione hydrolase